MKEVKKRRFFSDNNSFMTEHDYSGALKASFDMEIHSEAFGFNCSLSIEVSIFEYHDKYHSGVSNDGKLKMDFHSHFLDESDQNADTTCEHMKIFIHWMYEDFFINYGIIYDTTDGCSKQYRCSNALWLLSVLEFTYRVIIDI